MIWTRSWDVRSWTWADNERARECCEAFEAYQKRGMFSTEGREEYDRLKLARAEYERRQEGKDACEAKNFITAFEQSLRTQDA